MNRRLSPEKMARESGLDKGLLKRYMEYLEAAFLVKVVHKVNVNAKHFKRITGFKIYLTNPSLRTAPFSPVSATDDEIGNLVETAIFAQWMHRENIELFYAKWKTGRIEGEVDMIQLDEKKLKPFWCLDIKWSNRYLEKPGELKSLIEFCGKNNLTEAIVTTIDKENCIQHSGIDLNYYPAAVYTYTVGANTIKIKQQ